VHARVVDRGRSRRAGLCGGAASGRFPRQCAVRPSECARGGGRRRDQVFVRPCRGGTIADAARLELEPVDGSDLQLRAMEVLDGDAAKIDLSDVGGFERDAVYSAIERVRPGLEVLEVSARTDTGLPPWIARLHAAQAALTQTPATAGAAVWDDR